MPTSPASRFEFDAFQLEAGEPVLLREGRRIHLTPKAYETLLLLVRHCGRTLDKSEIIAAIWPDVIVEENNLNQNISLLRKLLGERPGGGSYIETVRGRGYRFVAPVRERTAEVGPDGARMVAGGNGEAGAARTSFRRAGVLVAAVAGVLLAGVWWRLASHEPAPPAAVPPTTIAVSIGTIGAEAGDDDLAARLAVAVSAALASAGPVSIAAPGEGQAGVAPGGDTVARGRALGADLVLEARLARVDPHARARFHLLDVTDGAPRWTDEVDLTGGDLEAAAGRLAEDVLHALAGAPVRNGAADLDRAVAHDLYLKGRYFWDKRTSAGLYRSIAYFEQALRADPTYAQASAGLAAAYAFDTEHWRRAEELAGRALVLDPGTADAHAVLGFLRMFWQWRWSEAEQAFKQAAAIAPGSATAHQWYAIFFAARGRTLEARAEMHHALALDPFSPAIRADLGQLHYFHREADEAIARCLEALEIDPDFLNAYLYLYDIYTHSGQYDLAVETFSTLSERLSGHAVYNRALLPVLRRAYETGGITAFWERVLDQALDAGGLSYTVAEYAARLGRHDLALQALAQARDSHDFDVVFLYANPVFRDLRGLPAFQQILRDVGLPDLS